MYGRINTNELSSLDIISYIETNKKEGVSDPIMDLVLDYCEKYDVPTEEIGYVISEDESLKSIFEYDCIKNRYIKSDKFDCDEW